MVAELLNYLDILSFKPEMKINGYSRFTTNFGKGISLISLLSIIIFSCFIIMDVLTRKTYTIIYNLDNREIPNVKINMSQIALVLLNPTGNEIIEHDRYFNFLVKYWEIQIPNNYQQNTSDYKQTFLPKNIIVDLPLKNCSSLHYTKFSSFYETFSKVYFSGVCIDFSNFNYTLFGKYGGVAGYSTLNIYIRKCVNSTTANKTNCYPDHVIDKKLSQAFIGLVAIDNDINSNNYQEPILEFYQNELLPVSSTVFKTYNKELNVVKFSTNDGYIFDSLGQFQTYRSDRILESVDLRGKNTLFPGTFSQITFRCSGKTEIYYRNYLKVPATFAYIGGILQVIILIGNCFVFIYSKNSMLNYLILYLFDYDEIKYELAVDKKIKSNISISKVSKIEEFLKSHDHMNKGIHEKLEKKGNKMKTINFISNANLEVMENSKNEKLSNFKNVNNKNEKENDNFKNNLITNIKRKDKINNKNFISNINLEENFFNVLNNSGNKNKKIFTEFNSDNNAGKNIDVLRIGKRILNEIPENINDNDRNQNVDDSNLNHLNEINKQKSLQ